MAGNTAFPNGVTADVIGNVTGNITGDVTGDVAGAIQHTIVAGTAAGSIATASAKVPVGGGGSVALTLGIPTATTHDGVEITFFALDAATHTVTCATAGFNAGNAGGDVATFGGAIGDSFTVVAYQGGWYVTSNINVTFG